MILDMTYLSRNNARWLLHFHMNVTFLQYIESQDDLALRIDFKCLIFN